MTIHVLTQMRRAFEIIPQIMDLLHDQFLLPSPQVTNPESTISKHDFVPMKVQNTLDFRRVNHVDPGQIYVAK